jgi:hypothetical protein
MTLYGHLGNMECYQITHRCRTGYYQQSGTDHYGCPTLAGQEVEQLVTFPIEQSIANVPDIQETRSISRFGLSVITVVFKEEC